MSTDDLRRAGALYRKRRAAADEARMALHYVIKAAAGTMSEAAIARATGVQRETVRKALGK